MAIKKTLCTFHLKGIEFDHSDSCFKLGNSPFPTCIPANNQNRYP